MAKVLVEILNPGQAPEDNGRTVHALKLAAGLKAAGAEVCVVFAGKGVTWVPRFLDRTEDSHPFVKRYGPVFDEVRDVVHACNMCCKRFDVTAAVDRGNIPIEGTGDQHIDIAAYVLKGYQIVTH